RSGNQGDEELAACLSGPILSHRYCSAEMTARRGQIELVPYGVTWTTESIIGRIGIFRIRIATHNHVTRFRPIKRGAVVKTCLHQMNEVAHGRGGLVLEQFNIDLASANHLCALGLIAI